MDISALAAWSQIAASLAVLATLIYLTIQIRQNTALMRAESRQSIMTYAQQELHTFIDHPEVLRFMYDEAELEPNLRVQFYGWITSAIRAREHEWLQYRNGVLDRDAWISYKNALPIILCNRRGREWWEKLGRVQFAPEFQKIVDEVLSTNPDNDFGSVVVSIK